MPETYPHQPSMEVADPPHYEPNLQDLVPDIPLLPGEVVVHVEIPPIRPSTDRVSVIKALYSLTDASTHDEVGANGPVPAALPTEQNEDVEALRLYDVLFGRDSLRVALDLMDRYPRLAHATIMRLATLQGVDENPKSGEEPGRILHEFRDADTDMRARELSEQRGWEWPYYESIDATLLYITAVKRFCKQEGGAILHETYMGRDGEEHVVKESFLLAVDWLERRMAASDRGLVEFQRQMGVDPESWRDSWDAFSHADGSIANSQKPIASVEVQTLAYDALLDTAYVYEKWLQGAQKADHFRAKAKNVKQTILKDFWVDDPGHFGGYFAMGLDYDDQGTSRQLQVRTSDMGHLLNSRLLDGDSVDVLAKKQAVIRNLFSDDMLNISGVRTLAKNEKRFRPGSYHNGSVWLWDTYYIAQGLERQGYYGLAESLKIRLWHVTELTNLLPEFVRGDDAPVPSMNTRVVDVWDPNGIEKVWDGDANKLVCGRLNRVEQPPQEVQAWTVAAILASKFKRDPLHPRRAVPLEALDDDKREFEIDVLRHVKRPEIIF